MKSLILVLALVCFATGAKAGSVYIDVPEHPNPKGYYLFYMHGVWLEEHRLNARHRRHGLFQYHPILKALANRGFAVISEVRPKGTLITDYAVKVLDQVEQLIKAGVPPSHITVTGFSKGGQMALQAGELNSHPEVNFVVMASCTKSQPPRDLTGRFLSLYDFKDRIAGSCKSVSPDMEEIVIKVGWGHGTFYKPLHEWTQEVGKWAGR